MKLPLPPKNAYAEISPEAARKALNNDRVFGNDEALTLVVKDAERAEAFELSKAWVLFWNTANTLYQSPYSSRYWEGTQTERANVPFFTVATAVNSLVPQILNGLFYQDPPFVIQNRSRTSADAARANGAIIGYQLDDIRFKDELRRGVVNAVLFGTGIWKWGWEIYPTTRKEYKRKNDPATVQSGVPGVPDAVIDDEEDIIEVIENITIDRPCFEHIVNLRQVLVDPGLNVPDIRRAKYVVHRQYMTWEDLNRLRDRPGYDIPTEKELLELFLPPKEEVESAPSESQMQNPLWDARALPRYEKTTVDPFSQPLEVLERWDNNRVIVVLQKKKILCNDVNPYGQIPFLSVNWWDIPEAYWGMGLAKTIGSEQRLQQGVTNAWLDGVSLNLNGVYVRVEGKSQAPSQSIRVSPGKIINVTEKDGFTPLDRLPAVPEAGQAILMSQGRAEQTAGLGGATPQGVSGSNAHSNLARTAAGAGLIANGAGAPIQDFVEKLCNQVYIPFLYNVMELNSSLLPARTYREILNDELEDAYFKNKGSVLELKSARIKFSIGAGARLQARRNMAQAMPIIVQFLQSPSIIESLAVEGKKVNTLEITKKMLEVADFPNYNDFIANMTPQDQQRWQMSQQMNKQQVDFQNKSKLEQQKHDNKADLIDQQNIARAGHEVFRQAIEKATEPEAITGEPGGPGFGSNVNQ